MDDAGIEPGLPAQAVRIASCGQFQWKHQYGEKETEVMKKGISFVGSWPVLRVMSAILISVASLSAALNSPRGQLSPSDYDFACAAATGGQFEVEAGRLAAQKAVLPAVKQFGEQMVSDHGQAGDTLKTIAESRGATLPAGMTEKQLKEIARLNQLAGTEFDEEYTELMVSDHKKDAREFRQAARNVHDSELKLFATETSQVIERHLAVVKSLQDVAKTENRRSRR